MPDLLPEASSPARDFAVASVRSIIVDVPTMRCHKPSQTSVTAQSYVIVQLRLANGAEGADSGASRPVIPG
jgi:muconate cycloisomerase